MDKLFEHAILEAVTKAQFVLEMSSAFGICQSYHFDIRRRPALRFPVLMLIL